MEKYCCGKSVSQHFSLVVHAGRETEINTKQMLCANTNQETFCQATLLQQYFLVWRGCTTIRKAIKQPSGQHLETYRTVQLSRLLQIENPAHKFCFLFFSAKCNGIENHWYLGAASFLCIPTALLKLIQTCERRHCY